MYAKLYKDGNSDHYKTYSSVTSIPDTNKEDWDDGSKNGSTDGMNDQLGNVVAGDGTWVWLFEGYNYDIKSNNIIVPQNQTWDVSQHGFSCQVRSFKVCNHNPTADLNPSGVYAEIYTVSGSKKLKTIHQQ